MVPASKGESAYFLESLSIFYINIHKGPQTCPMTPPPKGLFHTETTILQSAFNCKSGHTLAEKPLQFWEYRRNLWLRQSLVYK